nr:hypothetical protein [Bacillus pakistanensis]
MKVHVLVFPNASVAIQVTVVVPVGKNEPDAGVQTAVTPGLTVGSGNAPLLPGSLNTVMSSELKSFPYPKLRSVSLSVLTKKSPAYQIDQWPYNLSTFGDRNAFPETLAILVMIPSLFGVTAMVNVALSPGLDSQSHMSRCLLQG